MIGLCVAILGMVLIVALPLSNNHGRLAGYYLTQASPTPFVAILSLISSNVAGYTKKTTVAAMYLIGYCVGNIIGMFGYASSHEILILILILRQAPRLSAPVTPPATSQPKSQSSCAGAFAWASWHSSISTACGRTRRKRRLGRRRNT